MAEEIKKTVSAKEVSTMEFGAGTNPFAFISSDYWTLTDQNSDKSFSSQITTGNDGEFVPDSVKTFGEKIDMGANYESITNGTISMGSMPVGAEGEVAVDGISVATKTGSKATASVKAHKHGSGTHMGRVRSITIPSFNGWGASDFGYDIGIDTECVQSGTYDVSFGHVDQPDNNGENLIGITRQETHTMKFDYVSDTAPEDISSSDEEWIMTNCPDTATKSRDGFVSGSVTYVRYVAVAV